MRLPGLPIKGKTSRVFSKAKGRMVQPIQRVNLDLSVGMLEELDKGA